MKILVVCQHYWPEPYYLFDVCEEMARRGHTVHVITGVPNYPMGIIYDEYKHGKNRVQVRNGVQITRTFTIGRRNNIFFRILNYYSYSLSSTLYVSKLRDNYDVVFTNQTSPVMMSRAAEAYAKKYKKHCILYCMDLWPASLTAGGVKIGSLIYRFFGMVSKKIYNRADQILISSQMFQDYLTNEHEVPKEKIKYFPQYAAPIYECLPLYTKKETVDFVFTGNVGKAQRLDILLHAAKKLENIVSSNMPLLWHILGDGSELENLKFLAENLELKNVFFHSRKPAGEMPRYYAMADAMVVMLCADPFISMTLPSKMQSYMAAGKPIIAAANGEIPKVIKTAQCGFCAPAENAGAFAEAVISFLNCLHKAELGKNARQYYEDHFSRDNFMDELEQLLKEQAVLIQNQ